MPGDWTDAENDACVAAYLDLLEAELEGRRLVKSEVNRKVQEATGRSRGSVEYKFQNVSAATGAAFQKPGGHRGLVFGDLDNDGRMDVVVAQLNGAAKIFRNTTQAGHWLSLKLVGTKSNRMGIGARVRVTGADGMVQYNHATTSTGYAGSSDSRVHFGLGAVDTAKQIEIQWPSGIRQVLENVKGDRVVTVTEK